MQGLLFFALIVHCIFPRANFNANFFNCSMNFTAINGKMYRKKPGSWISRNVYIWSRQRVKLNRLIYQKTPLTKNHVFFSRESGVKWINIYRPIWYGNAVAAFSQPPHARSLRSTVKGSDPQIDLSTWIQFSCSLTAMSGFIPGWITLFFYQLLINKSSAASSLRKGEKKCWAFSMNKSQVRGKHFGGWGLFRSQVMTPQSPYM